MNKWIILGVTLLLSKAGYSDPECGTSDIFENRKPAITFQKIPMVNPETGEAYHPNDEITVEINGENVVFRAADYFEKINETEETLNKWGYSVRDGGESTIGGWTQCQDIWNKQGDKIKKNLREELAKYLVGDEDWRDLWDKVKDEYDKNYPSWEELYRQAEEESYEVNLPPVPVFQATKPTIPRKPVEFTKEKTWSWKGGSKRKLSGGIYPYIKFGATKVEAKGEAGLNVKAGLASKWEGDLLNVKLTAHSPGTGPLKIDLSASAVDGMKKWNKPLAKEGELRWEDTYKSSLVKSVNFSFSIGPIPMSAEFGLRGEMGVTYGLVLYPLQIGAFTNPYASADAYAQVGVDVVVASFGVGGRLKVIEVELPIQGTVAFEWDEEPIISLQLAATSELTMLAGDLYAYAKINYLIGSWKGKYRFFKWRGFHKKGTIFDYKATITRSGLIADGDLSPEDILERDYINRLRALEALEQEATDKSFAIVEAIAKDSTLPSTQQVARRAAFIKELSEVHDTRLNNYYDELRDFLK